MKSEVNYYEPTELMNYWGGDERSLVVVRANITGTRLNLGIVSVREHHVRPVSELNENMPYLQPETLAYSTHRNELVYGRLSSKPGEDSTPPLLYKAFAELMGKYGATVEYQPQSIVDPRNESPSVRVITITQEPPETDVRFHVLNNDGSIKSESVLTDQDRRCSTFDREEPASYIAVAALQTILALDKTHPKLTRDLESFKTFGVVALA